MALCGCFRIDPGPIPAEIAARPPSIEIGPPVEPGAVDIIARIGAGSARDPIGREGVALLTARALADELRAALPEAAIEARIGRERTEIRARCTRERGETCADRLASLLAGPKLEPRAVGALRDAALGELTALEGRPLLEEIADTLLYEGQPYGHPPLGREGVLPLLGEAQARAFFEANYVRQSLSFEIRAETGGEALRDKLAAGLSPLRSAIYEPLPLPRPKAPEARSLIAVQTSEQTATVCATAPLAGASPAELARLSLAARALGDGQSLWATVEASDGDRRLVRLLACSAPRPADQGAAALDELLAAVERWAAEGPDSGRLAEVLAGEPIEPKALQEQIARLVDPKRLYLFALSGQARALAESATAEGAPRELEIAEIGLLQREQLFR